MKLLFGTQSFKRKLVMCNMLFSMLMAQTPFTLIKESEEVLVVDVVDVVEAGFCVSDAHWFLFRTMGCAWQYELCQWPIRYNIFFCETNWLTFIGRFSARSCSNGWEREECCCQRPETDTVAHMPWHSCCCVSSVEQIIVQWKTSSHKNIWVVNKISLENVLIRKGKPPFPLAPPRQSTAASSKLCVVKLWHSLKAPLTILTTHIWNWGTCTFRLGKSMLTEYVQRCCTTAAYSCTKWHTRQVFEMRAKSPHWGRIQAYKGLRGRL